MIDIKNISTHCTRSEFVGTAVLDTIGLVISGIDDTLLEDDEHRNEVSLSGIIQFPYRGSRAADCS